MAKRIVWRKVIAAAGIMLAAWNMLPLAAAAAGDQTESPYSQVVEQWRVEGLQEQKGVLQVIDPTVFTETGTVKEEDSLGYGADVIRMEKGDSVTLTVSVEKAGLYGLSVDYYCLADKAVSHTVGVKINGEYPFSEARELVLSQLYGTEEWPFRKDSRGNEITPDTILRHEWQSRLLKSVRQGEQDALLFFLEEGENEILLTMEKSSILLGKVSVLSLPEAVDYDTYRSGLPDAEGGKALVSLEAERIWRKNTTSTRPVATRDVEVSPYLASRKLMSVVGGATWNQNGQTLYYEFDIDTPGWYSVALKYKQNEKANTVVRRTLTLDGELPFAEARGVAFESSNSWIVRDFGDEDGAFRFYLEAGTHRLGLEADSTEMNPLMDVISAQIDKIADIAVEVKKVTGGSDDVNRDWEILTFIPELRDELNSLADNLEDVMEELIRLNLGDDGNSDISNLEIVISRLRKLADDPDELPNNLSSFSEGSSSVSQMLGTVLESIQKSPMTLDCIYIHQEDSELPKYKVGVLRKVWEEVRYFADDLFSGEAEKQEEYDMTIDVWVNRAVTYVNELQTMTDAYFTPETGIKVNFSLMKDENKLILANTTNSQPDAALGLSIHLPYDLAIRGVLADLRQFEGFEETAGQFAPGALLTNVYEDGVYALPETQDFFVLYYRKDLLEALGIQIPDTWDEVLGILPVLQRYGMNFYIPLASSSSFKTFSATTPFFLQYGGAIYEEDGMTVAVNNENGLAAMKFMTDLFTIYGLPTEVADFYQSFRNGTIPIGVAPFSTYLKLEAAAAELAGKWDIAVMPGMRNADGVVERWATGGGTTGAIFSKSEKQEATWEFFKWWLSAKTQERFGTQMQLLYGDTYMWNTANVEAFAELPIADAHKEVIADQRKWLHEFVKTPASYMIEREISNVWNAVVFNGENVRSTLDDAAILMNQELARKWEEFGYVKDNVTVKTYRIPSIELIESWVEHNE
ncbi:MAG: extracellular solute-binding protein [Lachnospiraceae bacterium]|jgi:ABC-type glycerol-3-phosphate transport system substrate-binding protein|nr:extracellular solute-binding protein [Lachnospiraceae bacterium]